jgi:hypothetical protein
MFLIIAAVLAIRPPIACNLNAINHAERQRLHVLLDKLSSGATHRKEIPDGYTWSVDGKKMSFAEVAEWVSLESRCCPFLNFGMELSANGEMGVRLTGGPDVKEFIAAEMHKLPK